MGSSGIPRKPVDPGGDADNSDQVDRAVFDALPFAAIVADRQGVIVTVNSAARELFAGAGPELCGRSIEDLVEPTRGWDWGEFIGHRNGSRRCVAQSCAGHDAGDREIEWEFTAVAPSGDEADSGGRIIAVGSDITARRRLEDELAHSQKMEAIGRLASGIAHDFNNLLMGISGCADVALSNIAPESPGRRYVEELKHATVRGASLTSQLLAFAHKRNVAPSFVNLNHAIAATEIMMQRLLGETIELVVSLDATTGWVYCSEGRLEQVLMNLILNARDAMTGGGRLDIVTRDINVASSNPLGDLASGPYVEMTVTDTGCGMDDATLQRAFEPFFTTKGAGAGTGLGLATVYAITRQSGGHVRIISTRGRGTAVQLYLPVAQPVKQPPGHQLAATGDERERTALVVEDEDLVRLTVRHYLERNHFEVSEARNAQEAEKICREPGRRIDVVLSDVVLPGAQGPQLAERLRELQPGATVIYMSAYTPEMLVSEGRIEPGTPALTKPFSENALVAAVNRALAER